MPVNIIVGILALFVALACYSVAVWQAFRKKSVERTQIVLLWVGFVFDVLATAMMALQIGGLDLRPGAPLLHTVLAFAGMFGMLAVAVVATWASASGKEEMRGIALTRWALAPWAVWVLVFLWGMATRGAARMGG